jgi:histone deacetylase 11
LSSLHAFDGEKFAKAWNIAQTVAPNIRQLIACPPSVAAKQDLLRVHSEQYLRKSNSGAYILRVLEVPVPGLIGEVMAPILRRSILKPMLSAVAGTILATDNALEGKISVNLGGGYHHASRDSGGGFCIYSDVPIAIERARAENKLSKTDRILIVDLDAHQGNGFQRAFIDDPVIYFLDIFNEKIYPQDNYARNRIDFAVPIQSGVTDGPYLDRLNTTLRSAIDKVRPVLAYYIAGTDVHEADRLGRLLLTEEGIRHRDEFVIRIMAEAEIPTVVVTGGGYSRTSSTLIANMMIECYNICDK